MLWTSKKQREINRQKRETMKSVHFSSKKDDWETPPELFAKLNERFKFTLDVCASLVNHKCKNYFTIEDNGLEKPWFGNCWMNPPYGREIGKWMERAYNEFRKNPEVNLVMCLVPARTDTKWWHDFAMLGEITFIKGRIKFVGAKYGAPFPNAIVTFRDRKIDRRAVNCGGLK